VIIKNSQTILTLNRKTRATLIRFYYPWFRNWSNYGITGFCWGKQ